jgi:hypothetical protein
MLKLQIGAPACGHASAQGKRNDLRQDPPECIFDLHDQLRRSEPYRSPRIEPIASLEVGIPWAWLGFANRSKCRSEANVSLSILIRSSKVAEWGRSGPHF